MSLILIFNTSYTSDPSTNIGGIVFDVTNSGKTLTSQTSPTVLPPNFLNGKTTLVNVTMPNTITDISNNAFYGCNVLSSINLPASLTSIGTSVFFGTTNLRTIPFDPSSIITSIGNSAFTNSTGLTSITIPNSVTIIDSNAFQNCTNLTSINLSNRLATINDTVFLNCSKLRSLDIPDSLTYLGSLNFRDCSSFTSLNISANSSLVNIGGYAFSGLTLNSLFIPKLVTVIGGGAFPESNISSVTIDPSSVMTNIGDFAFESCSTRSLTIPTGVTSIGNRSFKDCTFMTSLTLSNVLTSIGFQAFQGSGMTSLTLPNSVTSIGYQSFRDCSTLTSVIMPTNIRVLNDSLFYQSGITSIIIPSNVYSIGNSVFEGCTNLRNVEFYRQATLTSIGGNNFYRDPSMTVIYYKTDSSLNLSAASLSLQSQFPTDSTFIYYTGTPSISNFPNINKTYGDPQFTLTQPTSNSDGAFTYTSLNTSIATVSGNVVTIVGAGSATIRATQAETSVFNSSSIDASLNVAKANPIITNFSTINKVYGDASFSLVPSSNSPGAFTYTNSNTNVADICGNIVTIIGVGSSNLTATQASTPNYNSGTIDASLNVSKANPIITNFPNLNRVYGDPSFTLNPSSNSSGAFTYSSSNTNVADISANVVTIVGAGNAIVTVTQAETPYYNQEIVDASLNVAKADPVITNFENINKVYGDPSFTLNTSSNSPGAFTYISYNTNVADVCGNVVTIVGAGNTTLRLTQSSTPNFNEEIIDVSLNVAKAAPVLSNFPNETKNVTDGSFELEAPSSNSPGTFTYTSSNNAVTEVSGNVVTIIDPGSVIITATQAETANYTSGTINKTVNILNNVVNLVINGTFENPGDNWYSWSNYQTENTSIESPGYDSSNCVFIGNYSSYETLCEQSITTVVGQVYILSYVLKTTSNSQFKFDARVDGIVVPGSVIDTTSIFDWTFYNYNFTALSTSTLISFYSYVDQSQQQSYAYFDDVLVQERPNPNIRNFPNINKTYGDVPFTFVEPTSNSTGDFIYSSSNTNVADVSGNVVTIVGAGSAVVTATQLATVFFNSGSIDASLNVDKAVPVITNFSTINKVYGDASFSLVDPSSNSPGDFTYTSSNTSFADICGNVVTIVGAGNVNLTASQAETSNFYQGTADASLNIAKANPVITNFSNIGKTFGNPPFALVDPSSNSPGAFTYTSSNTDVATISGNVVTIVGAGNVNLIASQAGTDNFNTGTTDASLNIAKANPVITNFSNISKTFGDAPFTLVDPSSDSSGAFSYTSSNTNVATISGIVVTIVGAGDINIRATQGSTSNYNSGTIDASLNVAKANPTISNFSTINKVYGNANFSPTPPSSNSSGAFTYTSSNPSVVTVIGGTLLSIQGAGSADVTATQASTSNYNSGNIDTSLNVAKADPTITNFPNLTKNINIDTSFALVQPSSNSSGAFTYTSSNTSVADVCGNIVTIYSVGNTTITASQGTTANYNSGSIDASLNVISQINPTITNFTIPNKTFGDAPFTLVDPSSNSDGAFSYTSSNTSVAEISGNVVTIISAGSAVVTATQAETPLFYSGSIDASLNVAKANPTITNFTIPNKTFGDPSFALVDPSSNSPGLFSYTNSSSIVTVNGNVVTINAAGSVNIRATQAATANYNQGTTDASLNIAKANPSISNFTIPNKTFGDPSFALVDPSSNSPGLFSYASSNNEVATISGKVVTINAAGSVNIRATQASTANYNQGTTDASLNIAKANPTISNFTIPNKTFGDPSFALVDPSSNSSGAFTYISSDTSVATISGNVVTILASGTVNVRATQGATANYNQGTIDASLNVGKANPVISNFPTINKTLGDLPFTLVDPSSNSPGLFSYSSSDTNVATISGTVVTIVSAGSVVVTATQAATANYNSGSIDASLNISPSTPSNPTPITNSEGIEYFLETSAEYGNITSNINVTNSRLTSTSDKYIFNNTPNNIKIQYG